MGLDRVTARSFEDDVNRHLFYLLYVGQGMRFPQAGLRDYLSLTHRDLIGFGTMQPIDANKPGWWDNHVRTQMGAVRGREGYFLFRAGLVVGHHLGNSGSLRVQYADEVAIDQDLERVRRLGFAGSESVSRAELHAAHKLIRYFDEIIQRNQRASGFGSDGGYIGGGPGGSSGASTPAPAPQAAAADPYEVLGVRPNASTEQIRKAYVEQMKLNHPDKVAHLSPALQKFASAQTVAIKEAYEALMAHNPRR